MLTEEMMRALEADGEKLKALTGEDHGPVFPDECRVCGEPIETCELCPKCALGNDPFRTATNSGKDLVR